MILLPNTTYVTLYSELAEAMLLEFHSPKPEADLYVTHENGDQSFTEAAQDQFDDFSGIVENVLRGVGIGQDFHLAETENMVVVPVVKGQADGIN